MAENTLKTSPSSGGRPPKYPWEEWFDLLQAHKELRLHSGVDFAVPVDTMRRTVMTEARKRGLKAHTALMANRSVVKVTVTTSRRRHDWARLLDGEPHRLVPQLDFDAPMEVMREQVRRAAKVRGLGLRSAFRDGALWVQALPADSNALESS